MASLLFRLRVSRALLSDNVGFCISTLESKLRTSYGPCQCLRKLSSFTGSKKIDFTDLTRPHAWYPVARRKKRKVTLHVGPTNSGKTYHALKQLELSSSDNVGFYISTLESKLRTSYGPCQCLRNLSSSTGSKKFDFTDLTRPHAWYPVARRKKRKVTLHVGPTNSGKTYHALKQLELSSSGIYCGPLRLLAWEVAHRMNKANVPCDLITGQEREKIDGAKHKAVTVEMADVTSDYSCAVVDEIQMLGCKTRGFSFTRALLGISADELHLCGDAAAVPLIKEILKVTDDVVKVQYYERLSPLIPLNVPLGSFSKIRTGDCIVTFSRYEIYKIKRQIESGKTQQLCSVVYGSLPPETRTRQAKMFNDENSNFDILVASDAIGMGLNLNISRIIFSILKKFDGFETRDLTVSEIKQIAGRAGRYKSKYPDGEVTCLDPEDLPLLHLALSSPSPTLEKAGLFPNFDLLFMYSRLHPGCGLYQILEHFVENAKLSENYFIANCEDLLKVAAVIDELPLSLNDKYLFTISPVDMDDDISSHGLTQFASSYAKTHIVRLREIFTPGTLKIPKSHKELKELESIHKVLDLYVWLSYHLEECFPDREVAASQKAMCSMLVEEFLGMNVWQRPSPRILRRAMLLKSLR